MSRVSLTIAAIWFLALATGIVWYAAAGPAESRFAQRADTEFLTSVTAFPVRHHS